MKILLSFLCFLRGHKPKYYLNKKYGTIDVRCKTCGCELRTDGKGTFWQ